MYSIKFQRFREFRLVLVLVYFTQRARGLVSSSRLIRSCSPVGVRAQGARGCLRKAQSQRLQVSLWYILRPPSKYPISIYHNDIWTLWESGFRSYGGDWPKMSNRGGPKAVNPPKSEPTIKSARAKPVEPGTLISPNLNVFLFFFNSFLHLPHGRSYKANLNV